MEATNMDERLDSSCIYDTAIANLWYIDLLIDLKPLLLVCSLQVVRSALTMYRREIMVTLLTIFASSFVIALSDALMPGPLLTTTVSESVRWCSIAGPPMNIGHGILELVLVIALIGGCMAFLVVFSVYFFYSEFKRII